MNSSSVPAQAGFDLDRIVRQTFVREVDHHPALPSTNGRGLERARRPETATPLLVIADTQTKGRGRGARTWWSAPGSLTFSLVLDLQAAPITPSQWPRIALAAAVAVCDALEARAPALRFGIRWPNDVCLGTRKACGILPELEGVAGPRLVLGVGINVNNAMDGAPEAIRDHAVSLRDATGRVHDLTDVLVCVLQQLALRLGQLSVGDPELPDAWARRCLLRGETVRLWLDSDEVVGQCDGIDPAGALLLRTEEGKRRFYGGTLVDPSASP